MLKRHGLQIPEGEIVTTTSDAVAVTEHLARPVVLKAQVPIGGRMKAGGICFAETPDTAREAAENLFNSEIRGYPVTRVLVEEKLAAQSEIFLGLIYDTTARSGIVLGSLSGGINVEESDAIAKSPFSTHLPTPNFVGREIAAQLGHTGKDLLRLAKVVTSLIHCFLEWDAILLEINPLVVTADGHFLIADAHLETDDDALYRQQKLLDQMPCSKVFAGQTSEFEKRAHEIDSADHRGVAGRLIEFEGNLGLLMGGGGASMTIFDAVLNAGLKPANYCEIGGNPSVNKVKELTKLIMGQPSVQHLAVIMNVVSNTRTDLIARGVVKGIIELGLNPQEVITVFRIPGSWEKEGQAILDRYQIPFLSRETSIDEAVDTIKWQS